MKIKKTISQQVEVEVSLPVFKKRINNLLDKVTYNAYYGEHHTNNFEFTIECGNIGHFNNWAFIHDFEKGEEITFDEFSEALTKFNELWHNFYLQVSHSAKQDNGEYYLTEKTQSHE